MLTRDNWRNWIEFLLVILPLTEEQKKRVIDKIGEFQW
jgi:hypothetical protein